MVSRHISWRVVSLNTGASGTSQAGLSAMQHYSYWNTQAGHEIPTALHDAFQWASLPRSSMSGTGNEPEMSAVDDRLVAIHPVFVIPWSAVESARSWLEKKESF
ncbi:MAG: hypothetical protein Q9211_004251 [Gyalolechia sp. 1 TL-2023]